MPDFFEIILEILAHFHSDLVLEQILADLFDLFRQGSQALLSILAVCGTAKIHLWIDETMSAMGTLPGCIILEEFHVLAAFRAFGLIDGIFFPKAAVLSRAFHDL